MLPVTSSFPLTSADVYHAAASLRGVAAYTPVLSNPDLDQVAGCAVACKAEALQRAGSFKFRGAYNAVAALCGQGHPRGVVGASSGNHAQALALAGRLLDVPVIVVVPQDAPAIKVAGARSHGAKIVTYDRHRDDREAIAADLAAIHGYMIVPSANAMPVMAGAGTAALELLAQAPDARLILVPVGGGGLAAGTAVAAKAVNRQVQVIGVEPRAGADTAASLRARTRVTLPEVPGTIADALRHTSPAPLAWAVNRILLDDVVTVTDGQIAEAMRWAFELLKVVVEPSGAVALAALSCLPRPAGKVGVIISGGSVDLDTFYQVLATEPDRTRVGAEPAR
jgi:threonine dehydratase